MSQSTFFESSHWLRKSFRKYVLTIVTINGDIVVYCTPAQVCKTLKILKLHTLARFRSVVDIFVTDRVNFFEISYSMLSFTYSRRIRVKALVFSTDKLVSCSDLFLSGNWPEREIWDLFGVHFSKHADLRRILTDYGFNGHPLRKDFPLSGYVEVSYSANKKRIVVQPLELSQEFRSFDFSSPWLHT